MSATSFSSVPGKRKKVKVKKDDKKEEEVEEREDQIITSATVEPKSELNVAAVSGLFVKSASSKITRVESPDRKTSTSGVRVQ